MSADVQSWQRSKPSQAPFVPSSPAGFTRLRDPGEVRTQERTGHRRGQSNYPQLKRQAQLSAARVKSSPNEALQAVMQVVMHHYWVAHMTRRRSSGNDKSRSMM